MSPFTIDANNSASECCLGDQDNGPPNLIVPSLPSNDEPSSSIATSAANRPVGTNNSLTSDAECHKCLAFLARALDRAGSKPRFLLRALGVASRDEVGELQSKDGDNTVKNAWYKPTEDGKGFVINLRRHGVVDDVTSNLPSADKITRSIDEGVQKLRGSSPENPAFEKGHSEEPTESEVSSVVSGKKVDDTNNTSNEMQQNHANNAHNSAISLRKKLTNAASLLVGGNKLREPVLTTSPSMHSHNPSENPYTTVTIECQTCGTETRAEAGARAFVRGPVPLSIVLCSNRLGSQREVDEVLIHELMHVYDVHSRQMDLRECEQLAYSEIRAAREAECSNSLTSFTSNICVKEKASVATKNMFPEEGRKCVCDVFDRAIHDLAPFSESGKKYPPFNNWTSNIKSSSGSPISPTSSNETKQPWASER
ncbi:hypothetical protein ACHAXS_013815 [Conticribra weissflogii]